MDRLAGEMQHDQSGMKAIVCTRWGFPRAVEERDVPTPVPGDNEVLVEVHAAGVNYNNQIFMRTKFLPLRLVAGRQIKLNAGIPGTTMSGTVTAMGRLITRFKPGDEVYGDLFGSGQGCFAEYVRAPEKSIALKPKNLTFEEAAAVPETSTVALRGLRDYGHVHEGQRVLIYSASGGIGTFAIQIAKYYGVEVTAVCSSGNTAMVRSLGADHVIDYRTEDFTKSGKLYDVVFAIRKSRPVREISRALAPGGIYVSTAGGSPYRLLQEFAIGPGLLKKEGKTMAVIAAVVDVKDLEFITELIEAGRIKPSIDRIFPFDKIQEAFRYYGKGHARGKVLVSMKQSGPATG